LQSRAGPTAQGRQAETGIALAANPCYFEPVGKVIQY
jgi:hypothetical protein